MVCKEGWKGEANSCRQSWFKIVVNRFDSFSERAISK